MTNIDKLAEALRLAREWFNHLEAGEGPQAHEVIAAADAALAAHEAAPAGEAVPVAEFRGRRMTPEGTREFWGAMLCKPEFDPPSGTKLYTHPPAAPAAEPLTDEQAEPLDYDRLFDLIRGTGYVTRAQAHEIVDLLHAHGIGARGGEVQRG